MPQTNVIKVKRTTVPSKVPTTSDIVAGELAANLIDKILYTRDTSNNIISLTGVVSNIAGTGISLSGTNNVTISIDSTVATLTGSQTLTNKTISGSNNTISNIGNSSLTNSSITINGTSVSLGGTATISASAGGSDTQVQYNSSNTLAGSANLTFDGTRLTAAALTVDTNTLYVDATNDRVGIGTSSPGHMLTVDKAQNGQTLVNVINTNVGTLSASGIRLTSDSGSVFFLKYGSLYSGYKIFGSNDSGIVNQTSGNISILNDHASGGINFAAGGSSTVQLTLASTGNVGIGTSSPGTKLEVFGSITARAASTQDSVILAGRAGGTSSYGVTLTPTTLSASRTLTLPDTTGTIITTGDSGTVTSTMIADGTIVNGDINASAAIAVSKLAASTISGITLGNNLNTLTMNVSGTGLSGSTTYNGSAAATFTVTSNATSANTASAIVARDASGNFSAGTITATLSGSATSVGGITEIGLFNNMGQTHGARTSFDATTPSYNFGYRYVQGTANGPGTSGSQFYSWYIGLGSEYPATGAGSYGAMFAVDRNVTNPYLSVRYNEGNSFTAWYKIRSGYADSAGSVTNTLTLATSGTGLSGSASYNGSGAVTFTVTSNATSANTASAIVARDASGNFSAGTITATTLAGTLSTAAQTNITSVGTLTSLTVSGNISIGSLGVAIDSSKNFYPGNQTSNYFTWDGFGISKVGGGYFYISNGTFYVQSTSVFRGVVSNDSATYLQINGGTSGHTYFNGNVGVGISGPVARLQSAGATLTATPTGGSATGTGLYINGTDTTYGMMFGISSDGSGWIQQQRSDANNTQYALRLNPLGGFVGIGMGSTNPGKTLDIISAAGSIRLAQTTSSGYGYIELGRSATATNNWHIGSENDGTFRFYNGTFGAGTLRLYMTSAGETVINGGGGLTIINNNPTITFQDTDGRSAFIHCNSNLLYVLRGSGSNVGYGSWTSVNAAWPLVINLETNTATFGGLVQTDGTNSRFATGYDSGVNNSMSCSNWFRSSGQTGWYNATYDGGIWMSDSTYVRVFNGKGFLVDGSHVANGQISARYGQSSSTTVATATGSLGGVEIYGGGGSNAAFMTFHRPGAFAGYFGLDSDNNFAVGGWSYGAALGSMKVGSFGVGTAASGTAGEIRATNNITAYYSDQRLKENIRLITDPLEKVSKISGVTFTQNSLAETFGYKDYSQQVGVIAQEIQAVLPEAVTAAPFDIAADGTSKSGENYLTVRYEKLVPLLIEAIKELSAKVKKLENK